MSVLFAMVCLTTTQVSAGLIQTSQATNSANRTQKRATRLAPAIAAADKIIAKSKLERLYFPKPELAPTGQDLLDLKKNKLEEVEECRQSISASKVLDGQFWAVANIDVLSVRGDIVTLKFSVQVRETSPRVTQSKKGANDSLQTDAERAVVKLAQDRWEKVSLDCRIPEALAGKLDMNTLAPALGARIYFTIDDYDIDWENSRADMPPVIDNLRITLIALTVEKKFRGSSLKE